MKTNPVNAPCPSFWSSFSFVTSDKVPARAVRLSLTVLMVFLLVTPPLLVQGALGPNTAPQIVDDSITFLTKWGSNGGANGQFSYPWGVAIDSGGNVYVADSAGHHIQKFDSSGAFLAKWGSNGSSDGQFYAPQSLALDSSGKVYVADSNNTRIQKFSTGGPITTTEVTMSEDGAPTPFDLTLTASDGDGDSLTWSISSPAGHGTAVASGTGITKTIGYTPTADYNGSDSFIVQVSDGSLTDTVTVSVTIESQNDPPTANDDTPPAVEEDSVNNVLDVLANDSILPDTGETLTISAVGPTDNGGAAVISGTTTISYTPATNFYGSEVFTYTAADGNGGYDTATVTVTVQAQSDAPVITEGDSVPVTMSEDGSPTAFSLTLNATDVDGDTLTWSIDTPPAKGTAGASGTGLSQTIGYTPTADYHGSDSFIVQVSDGSLTDTITVSVTVQSVNDAPLAVNDTAMVRRDSEGDVSILVATQPVTLSVLSNDSDPKDGVSDSSGLTVSAVGAPSQGGSAVVNTDNRLIDYLPAAAFTGTETFTYTASDGALTATATVTVTVVNGDGGGSIDPGDGDGETIIIPKTGVSQTITVTLQIPAGVATDTLSLVYNQMKTPSGSAPKGFVLVGLNFTLDAHLNNQLQPGYVFSTPITLTIQYSDQDVADLTQGEDGLELRYWTGSQWSNDGITVVERDKTNNRLVVRLAHLTEFALLGSNPEIYYFPFISKD